MSRLDEVISATQSFAYICGGDYARDVMLQEIAISLAIIADKLSEQHESEGKA